MKLLSIVFIALAVLLVCVRAESYEFQTEVSRMMDIIIHSLYSHKDIFLRELVSNSADALDKLRFAALTSTELAPADGHYAIRIYSQIHPDDEDRRVLIIEDNGIGMTKQELVENLGTIARSGTAAFMEEAEVQIGANDDGKIPQMDAMDLIGQFGVGFYSSFLVAEEVQVVSVRANTGDVDVSETNKPHIWISRADRGLFSVNEYVPDVDDEFYPYIAEHGTRIALVLRSDDESQGYAQESTIHDILERYSSFLHFPVGVQTTEEESLVYADLDEESQAEWRNTHAERIAELEEEYLKSGEEGDIDVADLEDDELESTEVEEKSLEDFDLEEALANESVIRVRNIFKETEVSEPLWTRSPDAITEEEYVDFYRNAVGQKYHDNSPPTSWTHFKGEGDVNFTALLYIPKHMPWDFYQSLSNPQRTVDLYIKRVFVSNKDEEGDNLLPPYLSYIRGMVDSEDLQINVSREMLQESRAMRVIKRRLERKAINMLEDLANDDEAEIKFGNVKAKFVDEYFPEDEPVVDNLEVEVENDEEIEASVKPGDPEAEKSTYNEFFNEFGKTFKFGIIDASDKKTEKRLIELLRYPSTYTKDWVNVDGDEEDEAAFSDEKHPDTALRAYVERMPEWQKDIYVIYGFSFEEIVTSPLLEKAKARGIEVLLCADPVDEMLFNRVMTYDGKKIVNLGMDGLVLPSDPNVDEEEIYSSDAYKAFKESELSIETIFEPLLTHIQKHYGGRISNIKLSDRLTDSPAILTSATGGPSAVQERYMKYQSVTNNDLHASMYKARRVMEINPMHPIITGLLQQISAEKPNYYRINLALDVLYDTVAIKSGWDIEDVTVFAGHVVNLVSNTVEDSDRVSTADIIDMARDRVEEAEAKKAEEDMFTMDGDLFDDEAAENLFDNMAGQFKEDL